MTDDEFKMMQEGFGIGCTVMFIVCFIGIISISNSQWQHDAIVHKQAHYDAETGKFEWNNRIEPEKSK